VGFLHLGEYIDLLLASAKEQVLEYLLDQHVANDSQNKRGPDVLIGEQVLPALYTTGSTRRHAADDLSRLRAQ